MFTSAINDVENDVKGKSNAQLLAIVKEVKNDYEQNPAISLDVLTERYQIKEINVVDEDGIIRNSTELDVINSYDMNSKPQSKEFVDVLKKQEESLIFHTFSTEDLRLFPVVRDRELRSVELSFVSLRYSFLTNRFPTSMLSSEQR